VHLIMKVTYAFLGRVALPPEQAKVIRILLGAIVIPVIVVARGLGPLVNPSLAEMLVSHLIACFEAAA